MPRSASSVGVDNVHTHAVWRVDSTCVSDFYDDGSAALVIDVRIVEPLTEERFSRVKKDPAFLVHAIGWHLPKGWGWTKQPRRGRLLRQVSDSVPRIRKSYAAGGPTGVRTFHRAMSEWTMRKLRVVLEIEKGLGSVGYEMPGKFCFSEHHMIHA